MNDEQIHDFYQKFQDLRSQKSQKRNGRSYSEAERIDNPEELYQLLDRFASGSGPNTAPRHLSPSFRANHFDEGETAATTIMPGETKIVAKWFMPATHSGVFTGFHQDFVMVPDRELVTWGIRINGTPIHGFSDFIGTISLPSVPRSIRYPLTGLDTLGSSSISSGSVPLNQTPTVHLQATNNDASPISVRGRVIGYTFPIDELVDNFGNI